MRVNVSTALLADCCPKECAVDSNYLLVRNTRWDFSFQNRCFSKKDEKSKTACWQ